MQCFLDRNIERANKFPRDKEYILQLRRMETILTRQIYPRNLLYVLLKLTGNDREVAIRILLGDSEFRKDIVDLLGDYIYDMGNIPKFIEVLLNNFFSEDSFYESKRILLEGIFNYEHEV